MMRQSEFKMRFDPELGRYTRQHIYGEGMMDVFKSFGSKLFGKTVFKIQITEIPLEKKLNTVSAHFPLHAVKEKHPIIFDVYNLCHNYHSNKLSSFNVSVM